MGHSKTSKQKSIKKAGLEPTAEKRNELTAWLIVAAAIVFVSAIRIRLLQIPLERDEGEFAYIGQLMLQGHPPYSLAYNMKLPGIYAAYAAIMAVFGQTIAGIHFGLLVANVAAIVLVFLLGRRLFNAFAGAIAAAAYAILTIHPGILGTSAHATHFVVLFALAGLLLLLKALDNGRANALVCSGLLFGIAFMMKQPGLIFGIFGAAYLCWTDMRVRSLSLRVSLQRLGLFLMSVALPYGITCLLLWRAGVFGRFWFWTSEYAKIYGAMGSLRDGFDILFIVAKDVILPVILIWVLGLAGLAVLIWNRRSRRDAGFIIGLFAVSFVAVSSGFTFREHYFVLLFPALSLLVGICVESCRRVLAEKTASRFVPLIPAAVFAVAIVLPVVQQRNLLFTMTPDQVCQELYRNNPFTEAVEVAAMIRDSTGPEDLIQVMGSEPEIYFYAHRHAAAGYVYMYSINEFQTYADAMRKDLIDQIVRARPKLLILINNSASWVGSYRPDRRSLVAKWTTSYIKGRYEMVGTVWTDPNDQVRRFYSWKDSPPGNAKVSVMIYRRLDGR